MNLNIYLFAFLSGLFVTRNAMAGTPTSSEFKLGQGWRIQDSVVASERPALISSVKYSDDKWYPATVPSTVLGNLISQRNFPWDPFYSDNLKKLPGSGDYYTWGKNFGDVVTPPESPFGRPWYYRLKFQTPSLALQKNQHALLNFLGITYGAQIWINGHQIANVSDTEGSYRKFQFDVTSFLQRSLEVPNVLLVSVGVPQPIDLTPSWVDWNPTPQDKNMGLWRDVTLQLTGPAEILNPQVVTENIDIQNSAADISIEAEIKNLESSEFRGELLISIEGESRPLEIKKALKLAPHETKTIRLSRTEFPNLRFQKPHLWWPAQMGKAFLYKMNMRLQSGDFISHNIQLPFGIRHVSSELTDSGARLFRINGKPIQIRGAGWSSDLFLRYSQSRAENEIRYVKDLGLNTIRLEGRFESEEFLRLTDQEGVLVMTGWVCCNAWQNGDRWPDKNFTIAKASLRDQIYQMRNHPSVLAFLYGSDTAPPANIESLYIETFKSLHWPNPVVSSAAATTTDLNGASGFKMLGPYDYEPPSYWYLDKSHGGAYGFNTETSPGPSVPPLESLLAFLPPEHQWPVDDIWNFHAGENEFANIDDFKSALDSRYGESQSLREFAMKSQVMGYDNHRAMFEAFGKNKYKSATGVIQWMLNNAWPSLIWHLYDDYLRPGGSYYGVKKSNQPLHIQYSHDDRSVVLVNSTLRVANNLKAHILVLDTQINKLFDKSVPCQIGPDQSIKILNIPNIPTDSNLYFVKLDLTTSAGEAVDYNFYWLSQLAETYDWDASDWRSTPVLAEADLTDLNKLPEAQVTAFAKIETSDSTGELEVTNVSPGLAFFMRFKLICKESHKEVLPILWQDNYVTLIPGEKRKFKFSWFDSCAGVSSINSVETSEGLQVEIEGWNVRALRATNVF
jgi:exo-1,4-beta-D-glucosaminidase